MKFEVTKKKIRMRRESDVDHLPPYDDFLEKARLAEALVDFTEQHNADQDIEQEAHKHLVVMFISAMETYFSGMAEIFVQNGWFEDSLLEILKQEKISLADLVEMYKEKITLGEIASISQSFQNFDALNNFYKKMLGCEDFVEEISRFKAPLRKGEYLILANDRPNFREDIYELLDLRHQIVHHMSKQTLSAKRLHDMVESLMDFVYAAEFYLMNAHSKYNKA